MVLQGTRLKQLSTGLDTKIDPLLALAHQLPKESSRRYSLHLLDSPSANIIDVRFVLVREAILKHIDERTLNVSTTAMQSDDCTDKYRSPWRAFKDTRLGAPISIDERMLRIFHDRDAIG